MFKVGDVVYWVGYAVDDAVGPAWGTVVSDTEHSRCPYRVQWSWRGAEAGKTCYRDSDLVRATMSFGGVVHVQSR